MLLKKVTILILVLAIAGAANAYFVDDLLIEDWSGTGSNGSLLVVDFWPGNGQVDSFAFGCNFSSTSITGIELLDTVHNDDNGFTYAQSGGFITDMWYVKEGTTYHTGYSWPDSWWSYWISDDYGQNWSSSGVGAGSRTLNDGDTDGWLAKPGSDWTSAPVTPVPEPMTIALLGLGGLLLRVRRK